ncbi:unnamed protein product [[Candida] boidinii]|nr:unnamed protein product [[Candida] boidinii]
MSSPSSKNSNNIPIRSTSLSNRLSKLRGNNSSGQNSANSSINGKLTSPSLNFEDPLLQQQQQLQQQSLSEFPDPNSQPSSISTNETTPVPSPQPVKSIQNNFPIIPELKLSRPTLDYFSDPSYDDNNSNIDNFFDSIEPGQNNFGVAMNKSKSSSMSYALKFKNSNNGNSSPNNGVSTGDLSGSYNGSPKKIFFEII